MKRMSPIASLITLAATLSVSAAPARAAGKPNIVYILVDNWGWGDISLQGSSTPTPRIDALARQGIRFTNFNIQNQCTPTRSAIHTGRCVAGPFRGGIGATLDGGICVWWFEAALTAGVI
jgi:arylsulfatase A-like enzyme